MLSTPRRPPIRTTLWLLAVLLAGATLHAATAAGGRGHSVVLLPDGTVWTFGANDRGQLGDGTGVAALTPVQVPGLAGVVAVASGDDHVLALTGTGEVWAWGANGSSQLGDGTTADRLVPVSVLLGAVGIDAGPDFSIAWKADGSLWTWGANGSGQLGDGTLLPSDTPAAITGVTGLAQASAGDGHVLALTSTGAIWSWGLNTFGQLGDGTQLGQLSPVAVTVIPDATVLVAGAGASYALRSDGSLWAWGANSLGQLGDGTTTGRLTAAPVGVPAAVQAVRAGGGHVLARLADGTAWSWGRNDFGQAGDGTLMNRLTPAALALTDIAEIAAGLEHSLAVTTPGVVWSFGRNALGQLGDGTTEDQSQPVAISGPGFSWKVGRPVLAPPEGTYEADQDVTVTSVTSGATILYSTDGTEPDDLGPSVASGGTVAIDETTTLKAQAVKQNETSSDVVTAEYTLQVPAIVFSPEGGTYSGPQTVTLTCAEEADIRYTEDGSDPDESSTLYSDPIDVTENTTIKARGYETGWEPSEIVSEDYEVPVTVPVEWTDLVGVAAAGSTLTKAAGGATAWDAGAVSTKAIASGDGWVEAVVVATGSTQMFGLARGQSGQGYGDIDFALYVSGSSLYVYESGVSQASLGAVAAGDTLKVAVESGVVRYLKNDVELSASSGVPVYPLLVDTSIKTPGSQVSNVTLSGVLTDVVLQAPGLPVVWTDLAGTVATGNTLQKTGAATAWDAGAVSTKAIASGDGWVEAVVEATSSTQMFGLAQGQSGEGYGDIDFALYVTGSSLYAYESGVNVGSLGPVTQGDRLRVVVEGGAVQYVRNGNVLLVSGTAPAYPLLVDTSIKSPGGEVSSVTLSGVLTNVVLEALGVPVVWTDLVGVVASGNTLDKTGAATAWDAGAVSTKAIASGDGWVEAVVEATSSTQMFGLAQGQSGEGYGDIEFALYVTGSSLYAYESGVNVGSLGPVTQGDRLRVVVEGGAIQYVRNGSVLLVSGTAPAYPLLVDTSIKNPGGQVSRVTILGSLTNVVLESPGVPVVWTDLVGVAATGNTLDKTGAASAWDAAGYSTKGIASGDGWVEAVVETTSSTQMFGLSEGNSGEGYGDIDFALYVTGSSLYAYESGVNVGSLGPVTQGDRLRVVLEGGLVRYERNGKVLLVSGAAPVYPLGVDTSIKNPGGRISSVTISGLLINVPPAAVGVPVVWTDLVGVAATSNTLDKTGGNTAWDAGAVSTKAIATGDGWVEAVVEATSSTQMFGLAQGQSGQGYGDIDFALYVTGSSLYAYESGVNVGSLGPTAQGDRLRVVVVGGVIHYERNGQVLLVSGTAPTYPLLVDTSIKNPGGLVSDVTISGMLSDVVLEPSGTPVVWTGLAGVQASGNTLEKEAGGVSAWDAGGVSTKALSSGDGWVEAVVEATSSTQMFGLAQGQSGEGYGDIDFALYVSGSSLYAYESGVNRGSLGPVTQGDRLRVDVTGGIVRYVRNGKELLVSAETPTYPLLVDTSIKNPGGSISSVTISGVLSDVVLDPPGAAVQWTDLVGVIATANTLDKPAGGASAWDAGAISTATFASGDGWVEVVVETTSSTQMFGLSLGDSDQGYADIDFALYVTGSSLFAYESGINRGGLGPTTQGDRLRVVVEGGVVRYERNGKELLVSAETPTYPLLVDTSIKNPGGRIARATIAGDDIQALQVAAPGLTPPGGVYTSPVSATLTAVTPGSTVHYSTDGFDPTEASPLYTAPVPVATLTDFRARAFKPGWDPSLVVAAIYQFNYGTLAPPVISPSAGAYETSVEVTLSGPAGAFVHYTTDGSAPTTAPPAYAAPFTLTTSATVRAASFQVDWTQSSIAEAVYVIKVATPVLSLPSGEYPDGTEVTITSPTPGATLHYSLDGSDPTTGHPSIPSGGTLPIGNFTLNVRGFKVGCDPSELATATYTLEPAPVLGAVAAGEAFSLALRADGSVWSWGNNGSGQLGNGAFFAPSDVPIPVGGLQDVVDIAAGSRHSVALQSDGTVWTWGGNTDGQLGDGTNIGRNVAGAVPGLGNVVAVAAGANISAAVKDDGTLWLWGNNSFGEMGTGDTTDRWTPVQALTDVAEVDAGVSAFGASFVLARKTDGSLWAWGINLAGQLGDGTNTTRLTPAPVAGLAQVSAVAAGAWHSLAALQDGTLYAWGRNGDGRLGDGTTTNRLTPTVIPAVSGLTFLTGGELHSLGGDSGGTLWAWGDNLYGQVGDGSGVDQWTPVQVPGLVDIVAASGGMHHSIALESDGSVWTWGRNANGQLGDGTKATRLSPVKISEAGAWRVTTPALLPAGGSYTAVQNVTATVLTPGATIHYTTGGADPTEADPVVASGGTIEVGQSLTLKARAFAAGTPESNVATEVYALTVATPILSPAGGTFNTTQAVTVTCSVAGATIHYTTNGADPTENDPTVASGATITVDATQTVKARAWKAGWTESAIVSRTFTMVVGIPTLSPGGGSYPGPQNVTIATVTSGATLHYTTNGLEPTTSDPTIVSGSTLLVDRSLTLRVGGWRTGWTTSAGTLASYFVPQGAVQAPVLSPAPGTYPAAQSVTLTTGTPGALIRLTLDGSVPDQASPVYGGPFLVDSTTTVSARAFQAGWTPSPTTSGTYTIQDGAVARPVISPPGGPFGTGRPVTLSVATAGATIHYTIDGIEPTEADPTVTSGAMVALNRSTRLQARAFKAGLNPSPVATADFDFVGDVAAGATHTVLLGGDGSMSAWGYNVNGEMGNGTLVPTEQRVPGPVAALPPGVSIVAVSAGQDFTLALDTDGRVWAWGDNSAGQLGNGLFEEKQPTPGQVLEEQSGLPLDGVIAVSAGARHSLALRADGTVWAWGLSFHGQIGTGSFGSNQKTATQVPGLGGVTAISAGGFHSVALETGGAEAGSLWAWGLNTYGQLGDGTTAKRATPLKVMDDVRAVSGAAYHTLALKPDGTAQGTGRNDFGQLGDGSTADRLTFGPAFVGLGDIVALTASGVHSLALVEDRTVWGTGNNNHGQIGDGTIVAKTSPVQLVWLEDVVDVSAGQFVPSTFIGTSVHSAAVTADGRVWTWGSNFRGPLGTGGGLNDHVFRPQPLPDILGSDPTWPLGDEDGDGLTNAEELQIGSDPYDADTNDDGMLDSVAVRSGRSATDPDMDGDTLLNADELAAGTDPLQADTDFDGVGDALDCFPLDPTRSTCPTPTPGDVTPPSITLTEPTNAVLISTSPP